MGDGGGVLTQDHDASAHILLGEDAHNPCSIQIRRLGVDQHDVGLECLSQGDALCGIVSFADDVQVALERQRARIDLHSYKITAHIEDVAVDVNLVGEVPAWRPGTGHMYFGPQDEHEFNWLPAVPQGKVDASYSVGGTARTASGLATTTTTGAMPP